MMVNIDSAMKPNTFRLIPEPSGFLPPTNLTEYTFWCFNRSPSRTLVKESAR
jgi:hypothetical protein